MIDPADSSATQFIFYTFRLGYLPYLYQADWSILGIAGFVFLVEALRFFFVSGMTMLITWFWLNDQKGESSENQTEHDQPSNESQNIENSEQFTEVLKEKMSDSPTTVKKKSKSSQSDNEYTVNFRPTDDTE